MNASIVVVLASFGAAFTFAFGLLNLRQSERESARRAGIGYFLFAVFCWTVAFAFLAVLAVVVAEEVR